MDRKLASVQRIVDTWPIEGADSIEVAQVLGWQCVVKKSDNFQTGDLVVYIEVDSIMPERPEYEFLRERKFRVRTIKLRKQVSQGLVLPLSVLPKGRYTEGMDVTDTLGVRKYDPQGDLERKLVEEKLQRSNSRVTRFLGRYSWFRNLFQNKQRAKFPEFIHKTDEDRVQLFPRICETECDTPFSVTEKVDGQSATYFLMRNPNRFLWFGDKYIFGVCSRNFLLPKPDNSSYWTVAQQMGMRAVLETLIRGFDYVAVQGEILGGNIQGNKYGIQGYDFYAFNLIYPTGRVPTQEAAYQLGTWGIKCVPILASDFYLPGTISDLVDFARGKSTLANIQREGLVVRNYEQGLSFKVINPDFLLKYQE